MTDPKRIRVTFDAATDSQAAELDAAWQEIIAGRRTPRFSSDDAHHSRLLALAERLDRNVDELVRQAIDVLLSRYEAKTFGGLLATQPSPDGDCPLIHARNSSDASAKPLCGANPSCRNLRTIRVNPAP
jgi:hypothetical protein